MLYRWFTKPKAMILVPLLLALLFAVACGAAATATPVPKAPAAEAPKAPVAAAPAATTAPVAQPTTTPAPAVRAPKVTKLIVSVAPLPHEVNMNWLTTTSGEIQVRPIQEYLMDVDWDTGKVLPMLATRWDVSPDSKSWTFYLRENVPFHFGLGNFTAKDVVHSWEMLTQKESINGDAALWLDIIGKVDNLKVVNDYQIVFQLTRPEPELYESADVARNFLMMSKAYWDKEGKAGYEKRPVGTGPYQYKERREGQYIRYEPVPYKHWRITPDAKELEIRPVPEDATRLATLLAGEAHIADLSRDLQQDGERRGLKIVSSSLPAIHHEFVFGGQYYLTPDKYDLKVPWADPNNGKLVREALNRAVNRKEMLDTFFGGRGEIMYSAYRHPGLTGWSSRWQEQFQAKYGYDPAKAKELLKQAGYPNGFKAKLYLYTGGLPGLPEMVQTTDAMANYFNKVGVQTEITTLDFGKVRDLYRKKQLGGIIWGHRSFYQVPWQSDIFYGYSGTKGGQLGLFLYEDAVFNQKFEDVQATNDLNKRAQLQKELGDIYFDNYAVIPLVWLKADVIIDPKVVAEYRPAFTGGFFINLEQVKLAR